MATQNPDIAIESVTILRNEVPSPTGQDGKVLGVQAGELAWVAPGVDTNDKVRASATDTTPSYLGSKLIEGDNVTLTVEGSGANEKIKIAASGGIAADEKAKVSATDPVPDYLANKLLEGSNISLTVEGAGVDEKIRIAADVPEMVDEKAKVSATDPIPDYLANKLLEGSNISLTVEGVGVDEKIRVAATGGSTPVQSPLIVAVDILGTDVPSLDRPALLYGGDYSAYPFLTIQAAIEAVGLVRGPATTINIGPGTWDPFRVGGISTDREFTIQGTPGTPIGPFEITGEVEAGWEYQIAGATWTPGAFPGMVFEVLSGPGAGSFGSIYNNGTDTIKTCGYTGDGGLAVGSIFQFVPFATTILGPSDPYALALSFTALTGRFIFKDLNFSGSPGQWVNVQGTQSEAGRITFYRCSIGGSSETGFVFEDLGMLVLAAVWFSANNSGGILSRIGALQVDQAYLDENWLTPMGWYSVGGFLDLYIDDSQSISIEGCRFNGLTVDDSRNVELRSIKFESGSGLNTDRCDQVNLFDIFGADYVDIRRARYLAVTGNASSIPMNLNATQTALVHYQNARVKNLSFVQCRDIELSNVYFPLVNGAIQVDCGYLRGRILYNTSGQVSDGTSFYPFSDFDPGPTSKYVTSRSLTITLESETIP